MDHVQVDNQGESGSFLAWVICMVVFPFLFYLFFTLTCSPSPSGLTSYDQYAIPRIGDPMRPTAAGVAHALAQPENNQLGGQREACLEGSNEAPGYGHRAWIHSDFQGLKGGPGVSKHQR